MVKYKNDQLSCIFHALADPTRRKMLKILAQQDRRASDLAKPFRLSLPAVSKHIKILERAQFIQRKIDGRVHWISFNQQTMQKAFDWINFYKKFWQQKLDHLDQFLNESKQKRRMK